MTRSTIVKKKGILLFSITILCVMGFVVSFFTVPQSKAASVELHGWAWSSNIGWVGFNCADVSACGTTNYKVTFDDVTGDLSGYAWSSSIGWITFDPIGPFPDGTPFNNARVSDLATGKVEGWIRACSVFADQSLTGCVSLLKPLYVLGEWDGFIELSGTRHPSPDFTTDNNGDGVIDGGVTFDKPGGKFLGFAWGGDVVGWLNFEGVTLNVPSPLPEADIRANGSGGPISVPFNSSVSITWCGSPADPCNNAVSCSVSSGGVVLWTGTSGTQSTPLLASSRSYDLICTNPAGSSIDTVTVNVGGSCGNGIIDPGEECDGNDLGGASCTTQGYNGGGTLSCNPDCTINTTQCTNLNPDFTLSCIDGDPLPDDPPGGICDLIVNFTPALFSQSESVQMEVVSQDGFNQDVTFSLVSITPIPPAVPLTGVTHTFIPNPATDALGYGSEFRIGNVPKSAADPNAEKFYTVTLRAQNPSGTLVKTYDVHLTLRATQPGFGEQ